MGSVQQVTRQRHRTRSEQRDWCRRSSLRSRRSRPGQRPYCTSGRRNTAPLGRLWYFADDSVSHLRISSRWHSPV